jgi:hypothetical protein
MPQAAIGRATRNPAIGPATAMSNRTFFSRIGSRTRMKAPNVPGRGTIGRNGRKYGGEASTPYFRQAR